MREDERTRGRRRVSEGLLLIMDTRDRGHCGRPMPEAVHAKLGYLYSSSGPSPLIGPPICRPIRERAQYWPARPPTKKSTASPRGSETTRGQSPTKSAAPTRKRSHDARIRCFVTFGSSGFASLVAIEAACESRRPEPTQQAREEGSKHDKEPVPTGSHHNEFGPAFGASKARQERGHDSHSECCLAARNLPQNGQEVHAPTLARPLGATGRVGKSDAPRKHQLTHAHVQRGTARCATGHPRTIRRAG